MPTRFIKESCRSDPELARVSHGAERLFWRLVTVADDFGRFDARPDKIHSDCFACEPLKSSVTQDDVRGWVNELTKTRVIQAYKSGGRPYGRFPSWEKHQTKRASKSKHPAPPSVERARKQMLATANKVNNGEQMQTTESRIARIRSSYSNNRIRSSGVSGPQKIGDILAQG